MSSNECMLHLKPVLTKKRWAIHRIFPCSNDSQCPVQVFEQVVRMLEPNRESYEPRDNSCGLRGVMADGPGPHRGRLRGQRLEPTEAHCACGQPHGIYEFVAGLEAPAKLKAQ